MLLFGKVSSANDGVKEWELIVLCIIYKLNYFFKETLLKYVPKDSTFEICIRKIKDSTKTIRYNEKQKKVPLSSPSSTSSSSVPSEPTATVNWCQ